MTRFIAVCVLGAGACVLAMVFLGQALWGSPGKSVKPGSGVIAPVAKVHGMKALTPSSGPSEGPKPASSVDDDRKVTVLEVAAASGGPRSLIVQEARVLPAERQDVPSEREGKLLFVATEAGPPRMSPPTS